MTTPAPRTAAPALLNLGCGDRFHPDWVNLDLVSCHPAVRACDLRRGIPYPDASFDVVYHSHVLEHLSRAAGAGFLRECARVLRPGGILRIAVPDLEQIARQYLAALDRAAAGQPGGEADHHWMTLELYDQTVRERPGGEIARYLMQDDLPNADFVFNRLGAYARQRRESARAAAAAAQPAPAAAAPTGRLATLRRLLTDPAFRREWREARLLGPDLEALELGRYRRSGDIHLWMYDRISLARVLASCGVGEAAVMTATTSRIPGWAGYALDADADGRIYKRDSLYLEGVRR